MGRLTASAVELGLLPSTPHTLAENLAPVQLSLVSGVVPGVGNRIQFGFTPELFHTKQRRAGSA